MRVRGIVSIAFYIIHLIGSLAFLWLTLGWRVRKARRALERQLVLQGMRKKDAKRISAQYSKMKEDILRSIKTSIR